MSDNKITFKASEQNKEPIALVLDDLLKEKFGLNTPLKALELASGTGQHVVHLAKRFPKVQWQPSEIEEKYLDSIKGYVEESGLENVSEAVLIDVMKVCWIYLCVYVCVCVCVCVFHVLNLIENLNDDNNDDNCLICILHYDRKRKSKREKIFIT